MLTSRLFPGTHLRSRAKELEGGGGRGKNPPDFIVGVIAPRYTKHNIFYNPSRSNGAVLDTRPRSTSNHLFSGIIFCKYKRASHLSGLSIPPFLFSSVALRFLSLLTPIIASEAEYFSVARIDIGIIAPAALSKREKKKENGEKLS